MVTTKGFMEHTIINKPKIILFMMVTSLGAFDLISPSLGGRAEAELLAYWNFEPAYIVDNQVLDLTGNATGDINGGLTFVPGPFGNAASFDGSTAFIEVADPNNRFSGLSQLTIAFWMYRHDIASTGEAYLYKKGVWGPYSLRCFAGTSEIRTFVRWGGDLNQYMDLPPPYAPAGGFFHYALTCDGARCKQYINGHVVEDTAWAHALWSDEGNLFIGKGGSGYGNFSGILDELLILDTALTESQVQLLSSWTACGNGTCELYEYHYGCHSDCYHGLTSVVLTDPSYTMWYADSSVKIMADWSAPNDTSPVSFALAQNEIRTFQIAVTSNVDGSVDVSAASSALDVEVYAEDVVTIADPSECGGSGCYPMNPETEVPDPLIRNGPLQLRNGKTSVLLIEVSTKSGVGCGVYTVDVDIDGHVVPVLVEVYDFAIPDEPGLKTAFDSGHFKTKSRDGDGCVSDSVLQFHGVHHEDLADVQQVVDGYYENYAEHRIAPYKPYFGREFVHDCASNTFFFEDFDFALEKYIDELNMSAFAIEHIGFKATVGYRMCNGLEIGQAGYDDYVVAYYQSLSQHLESKGWSDKAYIMIDEPKVPYLPDTAYFSNLLTRNVTPPIRIGPAFGIDETYDALDGSINLWIALNDESRDVYDADRFQQFRDQGDETWMYYIRSRVFNIDTVAVDNMIYPWVAWKEDLSGVLTWGGLIYDNKCDPNDSYGYDNPWVNPRSEWGNGQINFYYPPCRNGLCQQKDFTITPSLRLKLFREGMNDYEYLALLEGLDPANAVLDRVDEIVYSNDEWNSDAVNLIDVRRAIAREIERFGQVAPVVPDSTAKSRYISFTTPQGVTTPTAIRVTIDYLDGFSPPWPDELWVGPPEQFPEEDSSQPGHTFTGARLQCTPYMQDWSGTGLIHVFAGEIVPGSSYSVQLVTDPNDPVNSPHSMCVAIPTGNWGDVVEPFGGALQPDFQDVLAMPEKFMAGPGAPIKASTQMQPNTPNPNVPTDFRDIAAVVNAFLRTAYGDETFVSGPCACPSAVTCNATACVDDLACGGGLCVEGFCIDACGRCAP